MGMIGNAPVAGTIGTGNIQDGGVETADIKDGAVVNAKLGSDLDASKLTAGTLPIARVADGVVTAAKLASTAVTDKLGYTPVNKAGDTMTGSLIIDGGNLTLKSTSVDTGLRIALGDNSSSRADIEAFNSTNTVKRDIYLNSYGGHVLTAANPKFFARKNNGTQTQAAAQIVFNDVGTNVAASGYGYSSSTGRFTAPVNGTYCFFATVAAGGTAPVDFYFYKNGSEIFHAYSQVTSYGGLGSTVVVTMAKDEYVTVSSVQPYRADNHTSFGGFLIG